MLKSEKAKEKVAYEHMQERFADEHAHNHTVADALRKLVPDVFTDPMPSFTDKCLRAIARLAAYQDDLERMIAHASQTAWDRDAHLKAWQTLSEADVAHRELLHLKDHQVAELRAAAVKLANEVIATARSRCAPMREPTDVLAYVTETETAMEVLLLCGRGALDPECSHEYALVGLHTEGDDFVETRVCRKCSYQIQTSSSDIP